MVIIKLYIYDPRSYMYHIFLLPAFVDRGWQFIADDCGVKYNYNAVGQKYSIIHISNATYRERLVTNSCRTKRDRTLQLTPRVH